ncbi:MAG: MFS transporter [Chloroflexota bacterium]
MAANSDNLVIEEKPLSGDDQLAHQGAPEARSYWQAIGQFSPNAKNFLVGNALIQMCLGVFGVLFNLYLSAIGYSLTTIGVFSTMQLMGSALTAIPAGMFSDRVGRRTSLLMATSLAIVTTVGQVFLTRTAAALYILAVIRGAATTFQMTLSSPFLMENSQPRERMHLFSANMSVSTLASTAGSLLAGWLPLLFAAVFGWRANVDPRTLQMALLASIGFLVLAYVPILAINEQRSTRVASSLKAGVLREMGATISNPNVRVLVIFNILIGFGAGLVLPLFNMFLKRQLNATPSQVSVVMTGSQLVLAFATLLSPILVRKLGRIRAVLITQMASLPFLLSIALTGNIYAAAAAYWLRNAFMNMSGPISSSFTMEIVDPQRRATTNGLTTLFSNTARALAVTVAGYMMENLGDNTPYFGTAVLYTVASLYYYFSFRKYESHSTQGPEARRVSA